MTSVRHTVAALAATTVFGLLQAATATAATTLETVRQRGHVICGASQGTVGFGAPDAKGEWKGLDVDTCRSVAAAVFGDATKVEFVPLSGQQRISALQTGEIDVLPRTLTWTLRRDGNGINPTFPNYYEFTGFMVPKELGVTRVEDMNGASVCVQTGSTTEVVVNDVSTKLSLDLKPVVFDNVAATRQAFFSGRCDALITDAAALARVAALDMAAESGGAAVLDRRHDLELGQAQMSGTGRPERGSGDAQDVGDLDRGAHRFNRAKPPRGGTGRGDRAG